MSGIPHPVGCPTFPLQHPAARSTVRKRKEGGRGMPVCDIARWRQPMMNNERRFRQGSLAPSAKEAFS